MAQKKRKRVWVDPKFHQHLKQYATKKGESILEASEELADKFFNENQKNNKKKEEDEEEFHLGFP